MLSYVIFVPETFVTLKVDEIVVSGRLLLMSLQLPVLAVTQLFVPPGLKLPLTVALATAAPVLTSRMETVEPAVQLVFFLVDEATIDLTATTCFATLAGAPVASEYASRLGEPVPIEVS